MAEQRRRRAVSYPTLPEHCAEEILARLPFPEIFKVRVLSKAWLAKLFPIFHVQDKEKLLEGVPFQNLVRQHCSKWKTYSPTFVSHECFAFYDWASHRWGSIWPQTFVPELELDSMEHLEMLELEGALLLVAGGEDYLYVVNVITQNWKCLPDAPDPMQRGPGRKLALDGNSYKIIEMFSSEEIGYSYVNIYNSLSMSWRTEKLDLSSRLIVHKNWGQCLDGVVYWLVCSKKKRARGLLAFNVKEETFALIRMPPADLPRMESHCDGNLQLMVCKGSLMLFIYVEPECTVIVKKADLRSRRWLEESRRADFQALDVADFCYLGTTDGDSVFFVDKDISFYIVAYNVQTKDWKYIDYPKDIHQDPRFAKFHSPPLTFRPGLNPFVEL